MNTDTAVRTLGSGVDSVLEWVEEFVGHVQREMDALGELSPTQLATELGVPLGGRDGDKDIKIGDRMGALVDYLNRRPADLRITNPKLEHGRLKFGTMWLIGCVGNSIGQVSCPMSVTYYVEQPSGRQYTPKLSREELGALATLAAALGLTPDEVQLRGLQLMLVRHRGELVDFFGTPELREAHAERLQGLASKNQAWWQEVNDVLSVAYDAVVHDFAV